MKSLVIGALGGVAKHEHHKVVAACDNYKVLCEQYRERSSKLEHDLEKMEEQFLRASMQAEQLLERLRQTEQQLENKEEERANASAGWTKAVTDLNDEIMSHRTAKEQLRAALDRNANLVAEFSSIEDEKDRRIAELNTLITKESDGAKIEFLVEGGTPCVGKKGSRNPLRLVMVRGEGQKAEYAELRSLSYSKTNNEILSDIAAHANSIVNG